MIQRQYSDRQLNLNMGHTPGVPPETLTRLPLPDADILWAAAWWEGKQSNQFLTQLLTETPWQQETAYLFNKQIPLPRLTAWYGDAGKVYTYAGIAMQPTPWTETLLSLKAAVETATQVNFNSVLLNLYRDGQDSVGWHSDAEPALGRNPAIASISFGATRRFSLKHKYRKEMKPIHMELGHGSLLVMQGVTQHYWMHQVPKTTKPVGQRLNLTFRMIRL